MDEIELVRPSINDKKAVLEYKDEFIANKDSMDGTAGLSHAQSFEEWYEHLILNNNPATVKPGLVPATTYLGIRKSDHRIVGMIDIRHYLNKHLLAFGGHIGYSVRKSERRKGYATQMLNKALQICRDELKLEEVLVTCDKSNIGSAKTIISNGGVLENEVVDEDEIVQRYWINLKSK